MTEALTWLNQWQTLVAGLLAFTGAALAAGMAWRQLDQQRQDSETRRHRREMACRAVLLADCYTFRGYIEACYKVAVRELGQPRAGSHPGSQPIETPTLSSQIIPNFQNLIEHLKDDGAQTVIFDIVRCYQWQRDRLKSALENPGVDAAGYGTPTFTDIIVDTVLLWLLVDRLFPFSRNEATTLSQVDLSEAAVSTALYSLVGTAPNPEFSLLPSFLVYEALAKHPWLDKISSPLK